MDLLLLVIQIALVLGLAPLLQGMIKAVKARLQGRRGPGIAQPYRDLTKLLARESVVSEQASWVFRYAPGFYAAGLILAALLVPTVASRSPLPGFADAIVLVGLFALARFALALAALDTGSNFGGMGASREVTFAALVEPALLLVLFAAALPSGSTNLTSLVTDRGVSAADLLAFGALLIVVIAETGRIPIDNPDTHLELTMAHEGMILEYSGRPLGVLHWATWIKQFAMLALAAGIFLPWGMAPGDGASALELLGGLGAFALKVAALGVLLAVIESAVAKLRIFRVPDLLGLASVFGIFAVMATFVVKP
jgi:formate hydrogenlyase subunit 4